MKQTYTSSQEEILYETRGLLSTIESAFAYYLERMHNLTLKLNRELSDDLPSLQRTEQTIGSSN